MLITPTIPLYSPIVDVLSKHFLKTFPNFSKSKSVSHDSVLLPNYIVSSKDEHSSTTAFSSSAPPTFDSFRSQEISHDSNSTCNDFPSIVLTTSPNNLALNWSGSEPESSPAQQVSTTPTTSPLVAASTHYPNSPCSPVISTPASFSTPLNIKPLRDSYPWNKIDAETSSDSGLALLPMEDNSEEANCSNVKNFTETGDKEESSESVGSTSSSPFKKSFLQSFHRRSLRSSKKKKKKDQTQQQLVVPQIASRSHSLSRLSDAFIQVHNVCLLRPQTSIESEVIAIKHYHKHLLFFSFIILIK